MFNIDSFYTHGKMHQHKGQDYALHGDNFFIIGDGCSSSEYSDVAARLQSFITKRYINLLNKNNSYSKIGELIGKDLSNHFTLLGIKSLPLATLIVGIVIDKKIKIIVYGDGVITYKINNHIYTTTIEYSNNAPYYPYYYTDEKHLKTYKKNYPDANKIVTHIQKENNPSDEKHIVEVNTPYVTELPIEDMKYLYVFSDGINEFTKPNLKMETSEVISKFTEMKNTNGIFIQRRCARQLKLFEKEGILPMDDFSMSGIVFKEE